MLGLAALDEEANPVYDRELAQRLADVGAHVGAMTPGELAAFVAERVGPMRADLLALTTDALATLANRGLVKRATKELDAAAPWLATAADGTLTGTVGRRGHHHAAGRRRARRGACTCGASGVCRHVLVVVLAYQRSAAASPAPAPARRMRYPGRLQTRLRKKARSRGGRPRPSPTTSSRRGSGSG